MASKHSASMLLLCLILVSLLTPLSFAGPSSQTVKAVAADPAGLVAHYPFERNAINISGLGPAGNGILVGGPTYKAGVIGQAIDLDGSGDYVNCGNGSLFNLTKQLTIAAWIKVNNFDRKHQTIISKGDNSWRLARAGDSDSIEFACNGTAATKWDGVGEVPWSITGSSSVNDGKWHHIAGVFDGSALYLYIDALLESAKAGANSIDISSYEVCIGENAQVLGRQWNGLIDDVRIYNYGLSQAEIVSIMGKSQIEFPEPVPATLYNIAKKHDGLRKYEEAKGVWELLLKQYPGSSPASDAQIYLSKRNILSLIDTKDYAKAQAELDKLTTDFVSHPELAEAMYAIAERYELPGKYAEARSLYEQIVQVYADSPYAAKARYDGPEIYIFSLIASGKYTEAHEAIDKFTADFVDYPRLPGTLYWFAKRLDAAGQYEQARNIYQQVAWQYPNDAHATKALIGASKMDALCSIQAGDDTAVQKVLDTLIADFSNHPDLAETIFTVGEKHYYEATSKRKDGHTDQAKESYAKALAVWQKIITELAVDPTYTAHAYYFSAVCHRRLDEHGEAIEYFQTVINKWPDYQYAWSAQCLIGECYEKLRDSGRLSEAEANPNIEHAYQAVIENYPDCSLFGHALLGLAQLYEKMGNLDMAVEMYRIFIETADAEDPRLNGAKARLAKLQGAKK